LAAGKPSRKRRPRVTTTIELDPLELHGASYAITGRANVTPLYGDYPAAGPYGSQRIDSFNRADGPVGAGWVTPFYAGYPAPVVLSEQANDADGEDGASMRRPEPCIGSTSEAWAFCCANSKMYLHVRATADAWGESSSAYEFAFQPPSVNATLVKRIAGEYTELASIPGYWPFGGYVALSAIGNIVSAWIWSGGAWSELASVEDDDLLEPGYIGYVSTGPWDDAGGGDVLLPQLLAGDVDSCTVANRQGRTVLLARSATGCTLEVLESDGGTRELELAADTDYFIGPFLRHLYNPPPQYSPSPTAENYIVTISLVEPETHSVNLAAIFAGRCDGKPEPTTSTGEVRL
jgi:hypothetical protein